MPSDEYVSRLGGVASLVGVAGLLIASFFTR
jgi:hypothetical protein